MNRTDVAIVSALSAPNPIRTIGSAVWVYLTLVHTANHDGLVIRTRSRIAEALSISEEQVDVYLARLAEHHLIVIKAPSPYLVISLPAWASSEPRESANTPNLNEQNGQIALDVPGSSSKLLAAADKKTNGVRGPGEGVTLLAELVHEFPDVNRTDLQRDLLTHGEAIARRALTRVRQTPPEQIRKSRIALFRYLLTKLANDRP